MMIVAASAVLGWYLTNERIPQQFARAILPIVMPLIRQLGIDPIHFGIIVTINLGVGQQTPPVATVLLTTSAIAGLPFWEVFKAGFMYTLVLVFVTLLVTYVPWISLFIL